MLQTTNGGHQFAAGRNVAETNRILGPHPSDAAVVGYMGVAMLGTALVYKYVPHPWSDLILAGIICVELSTVGPNFQHGIRLSIPFTG
jgi:hypothetical protein